MSNCKRALRRLAEDEAAVTTIEYALVAALVAVVCVAAVGFFGSSVGELYEHVCSDVAAATDSTASCSTDGR